MASDGIHGVSSRNKVSIRNMTPIPVETIDVDAECLLLCETLNFCNCSERCQIKILSEVLNWWTKKEHVRFRQIWFLAHRTRLLDVVECSSKSRVSVSQPSIRQTELSDGWKVWMLKHVWLATKSGESHNIWQLEVGDQVICHRKRPLGEMGNKIMLSRFRLFIFLLTATARCL